MTMKPFEIQGADLKLGGVTLQAGSTSVVIPGITQATSYTVEEVKDSGEQDRTFNTTPIIIDVVIFNDYVANGSTAMRAEYSAELEDDGYIDEIEVDDGGVYLSQDYNDMMGASPLYAYIGTEENPFATFVSADWVTIPFRVKMRAGEVETIGGGGGGASALEDLDDVQLEGPVEGSVLTWDANEEKWVNRSPTGGNADIGDITFSGGYMTGSDGVIRMQTLDINQTGSYNFTPGNGDYSTAVWNETGITFNDPTQSIYDAIFALTDYSTIEIQISGEWFTVTSSGSSTPGMPQAPTLWLNETAEGGPLNIDIVDITINEGTRSFIEVDGRDIELDANDDLRMYSNDIFKLTNRSPDEGIEIETNDGDNRWTFRPDGGLDLPDNGDIYRNGVSVLGGGGSSLSVTDTNLELTLSDTNEDGYEIRSSVNNGSGTQYSSTELSYDRFSIRTNSSSTEYQWRFEDNGEFRIPGNINTFDANIEIVAMNAGGAGDVTIKTVSNMNSIHFSQVQLTQNGVTITTDMDNTEGGKTFTFNDDGDLVLPDEGDILRYNGEGYSSALFSGVYDDLIGKPTIPSLGALTVSVNTIQGGTAGQVGTTFSKTEDFNGSDYSTGGGTLPFINMGADSDVDNVRAGWIVTFASGETRIVASDPYKPLGTYWNISFNSSYSWNAGDVMPITFSSPDYVAGSDPVVSLSADTKTWTFDNTGTLTLPPGGDIVDSTGASVLGGGGGTTLPSNASGYLNNDGSGTLTWVPGNPSGAGALPYNEVVVFSNTVVGDWTAYTLSGTMDAFYDWNNGYATITLSSEPAYGKQITPNTKRLWINDSKIDNNDYIVIEFPASPAVGDVFTVPMVSPTTIVNAGSFVIGETYTIVSTGTTSWTSIGASYGGAGQSFVATGQGSGTGTASTSTGAKKVIFKPQSGARAQTMMQGNLGAVVFGQGGDYDFMYIDLSGQNSGNPVTWVYAGVIDSIPTWYQFYF